MSQAKLAKKVLLTYIPAKCPSETTHTFTDEVNLPLLTFCKCGEWQIIQIIKFPTQILCINIHGLKQVFYRDL